MDLATLKGAMRTAYPRALAAATRLLWSYPDAGDLAPEDLVHSAARELLQKLTTKQLPDCSAEQFFVRTIQNRIKDHVRNKRARAKNAITILTVSAAAVTADADVQPERLARWLKTEALLDGGYPIVEVVEALLAGIYHKPDIAELIGCRTEDVENCLRRLRTRLRKMPDFAMLCAAKHFRSAP